MKVRITRAGDSSFQIGDVVSVEDFAEMVLLILVEGGEMPIAILVPGS